MGQVLAVASAICWAMRTEAISATAKITDDVKELLAFYDYQPCHRRDEASAFAPRRPCTFRDQVTAPLVTAHRSSIENLANTGSETRPQCWRLFGEARP
jgi:hypothetical protein